MNKLKLRTSVEFRRLAYSQDCLQLLTTCDIFKILELIRKNIQLSVLLCYDLKFGGRYRRTWFFDWQLVTVFDSSTYSRAASNVLR